MSKKIRPSLKDYLRTGQVHLEAANSQSSQDNEVPELEGKSLELNVRKFDFLELLSPFDREMWGPILHAGTEFQMLPIDFVALREDFRTMDRSRFTYYILDRKGEPLRPVRTSVQIREPLIFLIKWDEIGALSLYAPEGRLQICEL